jgi:hypothetical protein
MVAATTGGKGETKRGQEFGGKGYRRIRIELSAVGVTAPEPACPLSSLSINVDVEGVRENVLARGPRWVSLSSKVPGGKSEIVSSQKSRAPDIRFLQIGGWPGSGNQNSSMQQGVRRVEGGKGTAAWPYTYSL